MADDLKLTNLTAEAASENQATDVVLRSLKGEPYVTQAGAPVVARVLGVYAEKVRVAQDENAQAMRRQQAREFTPEIAREARIAATAAAVESWTLEDAEHRPIPCTPANVRAVFAIAPWLMDQIDDAMRRHAVFFGAGSTS